jgi:N12 class adenine-specific DNA methylase
VPFFVPTSFGPLLRFRRWNHREVRYCTRKRGREKSSYLDDTSVETSWSIDSVKISEQTASVAERFTLRVATPERSVLYV